MLTTTSFTIYSVDFQPHENIYVATIAHNLGTRTFMVHCATESGSVLYDYEKPDTNYLHIKLMSPETVTVHLIHKQ